MGKEDRGGKDKRRLGSAALAGGDTARGEVTGDGGRERGSMGGDGVGQKL